MIGSVLKIYHLRPIVEFDPGRQRRAGGINLKNVGRRRTGINWPVECRSNEVKLSLRATGPPVKSAHQRSGVTGTTPDAQQVDERGNSLIALLTPLESVDDVRRTYVRMKDISRSCQDRVSVWRRGRRRFRVGTEQESSAEDGCKYAHQRLTAKTPKPTAIASSANAAGNAPNRRAAATRA